MCLPPLGHAQSTNTRIYVYMLQCDSNLAIASQSLVEWSPRQGACFCQMARRTRDKAIIGHTTTKESGRQFYIYIYIKYVERDMMTTIHTLTHTSSEGAMHLRAQARWPTRRSWCLWIIFLRLCALTLTKNQAKHCWTRNTQSTQITSVLVVKNYYIYVCVCVCLLDCRILWIYISVVVVKSINSSYRATTSKHSRRTAAAAAAAANQTERCIILSLKLLLWGSTID